MPPTSPTVSDPTATISLHGEELGTAIVSITDEILIEYKTAKETERFRLDSGEIWD